MWMVSEFSPNPVISMVAGLPAILLAHLKAAKAQWVGKFGYLLLVIGQGFFGCCPPLTAIGLLVIAPPLKGGLGGESIISDIGCAGDRSDLAPSVFGYIY